MVLIILIVSYAKNTSYTSKAWLLFSSNYVPTVSNFGSYGLISDRDKMYR